VVKTASLADVKAHLSSYVKASVDGPIVVTRNGKPVAVLLAVRDEHELERLTSRPPRRLGTILEAARKRIRESGGISHEEFWRRVEARARTSKRKPTRRKTA
jgi:prevent-host-death family protein